MINNGSSPGGPSQNGPGNHQAEALSLPQIRVLLASVFIIAACSLLYELLISSLSTYLLGSSVVHYSVTIGLFLFFMGVGSWLARFINHSLIAAFVSVELAIGLIGGVSALALHAVYVWSEAYYPAMVLVIALISTLIGLEIPLLTRLFEQTHGLKKGISEVLTFDYLGALLASLLFPFVLLPWFGHLIAAAGTGLLNLVVALCVAWQCREHLGPKRWPVMAFAVLSLAALTSVLVLTKPLQRILEQNLYQDTVIHSEQTTYQKIVVTKLGQDTRLYLNGSLQFSSTDEHRYHEVISHVPAAFSLKRERALVIGGGDGLAVRELLHYESIQEIVLVDIDPAVTQLATRLPAWRALSQNSLSSPRVQIVHADAWTWLANAGDLFDLIIVDLPDPSSEDTARLYTVAFYHRLARRLATGGVVMTQATSPWFAPSAFWAIGETLGEVFDDVRALHVYVPSFGPWGFFLASRHSLPDAPVHEVHSGRFINREALDTALSLPEDFARIDVDVNRIGQLSLLRYYREGWNIINTGKARP